jgi:hypothetical protein
MKKLNTSALQKNVKQARHSGAHCNTALGRLRQENHEFKVSLGYILIPCLKKKKSEIVQPLWKSLVSSQKVKQRISIHCGLEVSPNSHVLRNLFTSLWFYWEVVEPLRGRAHWK